MYMLGPISFVRGLIMPTASPNVLEPTVVDDLVSQGLISASDAAALSHMYVNVHSITRAMWIQVTDITSAGKFVLRHGFQGSRRLLQRQTLQHPASFKQHSGLLPLAIYRAHSYQLRHAPTASPPKKVLPLSAVA